MADSDDEKRTAKKKGKGRKFTKKSKEYKKLEKMFKENKIRPSDKPSEVRAKEPEFQNFTTTQFRSQYNKLKIMYGTCTKEGMKMSTVLLRDDVLILSCRSQNCLLY